VNRIKPHTTTEKREGEVLLHSAGKEGRLVGFKNTKRLEGLLRKVVRGEEMIVESLGKTKKGRDKS